MICPHCGHMFPKVKPPELKAKALEFHKKGYSLRDIEKELGGLVNFSTICRWIRKSKEV